MLGLIHETFSQDRPYAAFQYIRSECLPNHTLLTKRGIYFINCFIIRAVAPHTQSLFAVNSKDLYCRPLRSIIKAL